MQGTYLESAFAKGVELNARAFAGDRLVEGRREIPDDEIRGLGTGDVSNHGMRHRSRTLSSDNVIV